MFVCILWLMPTDASDVSKRDLIHGTLLLLQSAMPTAASRAVCRRFMERLHYTAPEAMDNRWAEIYEFLSTQLPSNKALQDIWNNASARYGQI